jgi:hypothetical protein
VKKSETESAATDSRDGMGSSTESSATKSTEHIETIPKTELSGVVGRVIPLDTPARNSLRVLNAEEQTRLWRISRDRANRFMVSAVDVDFLLDVIVRLSR